MKSAQAKIIVFVFLAGLFLFQFVPSTYAVGYTTYQFTNNNFNESSLAIKGQYLAWIANLGTGTITLSLADYLRGDIRGVDGSTDPKKDPYVSINGRLAWAQGSGTSTDIFAYVIGVSSKFRVTNNNNNNRKPMIAQDRMAWIGTDGTNDQIWTVDIYNQTPTQVTNNTTAKGNPFIAYLLSQDHYVIFWTEDGVIKYWENESGTPTTNTAHTPGAGCTDVINDIVPDGRGFIVFVEDCPTTDIVRGFDVGADVTITSDDAVAQVSSSTQTAGSDPHLSLASGTLRTVWVEGSGTSAEIWACKSASACDTGSNRVQVTSNSLLDDSPNLADDRIVWHRQNADSTEDIIGYNITTAALANATSDAAADTNPLVSDINDDNTIYWGAMLRTPTGTSDTEIFIAASKPDTNTGTNVVNIFGGGSQITFANVTVAGETYFTARPVSSFGGSTGVPSSGFSIGSNPIYYDITTTATWTSTVTPCFDYSQGSINGDESLLQVFHYEGGAWTDKTGTLDTSANNICTTGLTSLSPFQFKLRAPTIINSVEPSSVSSSDSSTNVTIKGSGFLTGPTVKLSMTTPDQTNNQGKVIKPGTTTEVALENVQYVDDHTLTATIPAVTTLGTYDLVLDNRYGSGAQLSNVFTVSGPTLEELKSLLAAAGFNEHVVLSLQKHLQRAEEAFAAGDTQKALAALKAFKSELEGLLSKPQGFLNIVKTAFAQGKSQDKAQDKSDSSKKNTVVPSPTPVASFTPVASSAASISEPTPTPAPIPASDPSSEKVNPETVKALLSYTDKLIKKYEGDNFITSLFKNTQMLGEASTGGMSLALALAGGAFFCMTYLVVKKGAKGNKWCLHCHAFSCSLENHPHTEKSEVKEEK